MKALIVLLLSFSFLACWKSENKPEKVDPIQPLFEANKNLIENIKSGKVGFPEYQKMSENFQNAFAKRSTAIKHDSGLMYEILRKGNGKSPKSKSRVKVHYKVLLIDGTQMDSSYEREKKAELELVRMIPAWSIGLPLMKEGGKYRLVSPPSLAYKDNSDGRIPANSTLVFEIELFDVLRDGPEAPIK